MLPETLAPVFLDNCCAVRSVARTPPGNDVQKKKMHHEKSWARSPKKPFHRKRGFARSVCYAQERLELKASPPIQATGPSQTRGVRQDKLI
jgi:hypothetical protein